MVRTLTYRLVLLSILFRFLYHTVNFVLTETALIILDSDLLLLACIMPKAE